jgi:RsiW-degrading membrane proteinase PrsW (M82 family)
VKGLWVLFLLIFIAALPVFLVLLWFRRLKIKGLWFLLSLASGIISLLIAAVIQNFLPFPAAGGQIDPSSVLFGVFIRVALVEELSRLITLYPLLRWGHTREGAGGAFVPGALAGLAAGLAFAAVESASYGAADIGIVLLRVFTAAPLHGACGIRIGAAADLLTGNPRKSPVLAAFRFFSAVMIHGIYDLIIAAPGIPAFLSVLIALAALASSLAAIRGLRGPR